MNKTTIQLADTPEPTVRSSNFEIQFHTFSNAGEPPMYVNEALADYCQCVRRAVLSGIGCFRLLVDFPEKLFYYCVEASVGEVVAEAAFVDLDGVS